MKSLVHAVVAALALTASLSAFAQSGLTRAQVRDELVQLRQAGYNPNASDANYPETIQNAEAHVQSADNSGYGAQAAPVVRGARPVAAAQGARDSVYFGH